MRNIVIVESPAKAKTINKYLGKDFKVLACFGHIRDLPSKDGSVDTSNNFVMHYQTNSNSVKHIKEIKSALRDAEKLYLATDPDREGEAISWHLQEVLTEEKALTKKIDVKRIVFHEITKKAINQAINEPRDIDMDLVDAQQARRALDYLVGFNISPVLWRKLPGSKSAGRVQSVALRLIVDREEEIERFITQEYWQIFLNLITAEKKVLKAKLVEFDKKKLDKFDINTEQKAKEAKEILSKCSFAVESIENKQSKRNPYPPFITSTLQQEASRKLGFSASKTMMVAQKLYEGVEIGGETVGLITYMRTDGTTLSEDFIAATRSLIKANYGEKYLPSSKRIYKSKIKNAQEAHEAIRPTDVSITPEKAKQFLDHDFFRLYELIWKRSVACQMESAVFDQQVILIISNDKKHRARLQGSVLKFDGFYRVYNEDTDDPVDQDEENQILPYVKEQENLDLKNIEETQHFTEAPPRYSEASLVKKLEELGIGRPSTYASILSVLQERQYVKLDKKRFIPEERGRLVSAFLINFFKRIVEYDFTAGLEEELDDISNGKVEWRKMLDKFWQPFHSEVDNALKIPTAEVLDKLNEALLHHLFANKEGKIDRSCPVCKEGEQNLRIGKFGAFIACSKYPDCNYTRAIDISENALQGGAATNINQLLGQDSKGANVYLKKGPYGYYVQSGEDADKESIKRISVPKGVEIDQVDMNKALDLLSLPKTIGVNPETGKDIVVNIGKFGPYILHDKRYHSISSDDVFTIGINRAVSIIHGDKSATSKALKDFGEIKEIGENVAIYQGKFGPYVKLKSKNVPLSRDLKNKDIVDITIDEITNLISNYQPKERPLKNNTAKNNRNKTEASKEKTETKKAKEDRSNSTKKPTKKSVGKKSKSK